MAKKQPPSKDEAKPVKVVKANTANTKQGVPTGAKRKRKHPAKKDRPPPKPVAPSSKFTVGNSLWRLANRADRPKAYNTSLDLAIACDAYFAWVEANPLQEQKIYIVDNKVEKVPVDKMRPMSRVSLSIFLGMSATNFELTYEKSKDPEIRNVAQSAMDVIFSQQFDGAACGLLNAAIISRSLGLKDQIENHNIDVVELRRFGNKQDDGGGGDGVDNTSE